jgi:hypothetical protein
MPFRDCWRRADASLSVREGNPRPSAAGSFCAELLETGAPKIIVAGSPFRHTMTGRGARVSCLSCVLIRGATLGSDGEGGKGPVSLMSAHQLRALGRARTVRQRALAYCSSSNRASQRFIIVGGGISMAALYLLWEGRPIQMTGGQRSSKPP